MANQSKLPNTCQGHADSFVKRLVEGQKSRMSRQELVSAGVNLSKLPQGLTRERHNKPMPGKPAGAIKPGEVARRPDAVGNRRRWGT